MKALFLNFTVACLLLAVGPVASASLMCADIFSRKTFNWPTDLKVADHDEITGFITDVLKDAVSFREKSTVLGSVDWVGPKSFKHLSMAQVDIAERFSQKSLKYHAGHDRTPLDVAIWTFLNVGMDLGVQKMFANTSGQKALKDVKILKVLLENGSSQGEVLALLKRLQDTIDSFTDIHAVLKTNSAETVAAGELVVAATAKIIKRYYKVTEKTETLEKTLSAILPFAEQQGLRQWYSSGVNLHFLQVRISYIIGLIEDDRALSFATRRQSLDELKSVESTFIP